MEEPIMNPESEWNLTEDILQARFPLSSEVDEELNAWLDEQELYAQEQEMPEDY